jgi:hypothetical protein
MVRRPNTIGPIHTGTPVKSIFNPHANGCVALDMTDDAAYVATLSAPHNEDPQVTSAT